MEVTQARPSGSSLQGSEPPTTLDRARPADHATPLMNVPPHQDSWWDGLSMVEKAGIWVAGGAVSTALAVKYAPVVAALEAVAVGMPVVLTAGRAVQSFTGPVLLAGEAALLTVGATQLEPLLDAAVAAIDAIKEVATEIDETTERVGAHVAGEIRQATLKWRQELAPGETKDVEISMGRGRKPGDTVIVRVTGSAVPSR